MSEKEPKLNSETDALAGKDELTSFMKQFMDRELELRKDDLRHRNEYLKHNKDELRDRKIRTWGILGLMVLGPLLYWLIAFTLFGEKGIAGDYVAVVRVDGEIAANSNASAEVLVPAIKEAFEDKKAKGVVLLINSPGGSPVQSSIIHDAILKYRKQYPAKKVVAVGEDMLTSGAYWIATAAPEIYCNRSTLAGSIGVIMSGFGVDIRQYQKYGIERRVWTAGEHKDRMDSFRPMNKGDEEKVMSVMGGIHQHFIAAVEDTRKGRIKAPASVVYSGDFWAGDEAVKLGLVDGLADFNAILSDKFKVDKVADYTPRKSIFDSMKKSFRSELSGALLQTIENVGGNVGYRIE